MSSTGKSVDKVHYEFRPAKQVERRMLLHLLHRLSEAGFGISTYQYTGLGSIYFVDFILLYRYLGIRDMVSVEGDMDIKKRVHFNKPYGKIEIFMGDVAEYIPQLSRDRKHILWLDFDFVIDSGAIASIVLAASQLSPGSILLVTVDAEPPGPPEWGPRQWCQYFKSEAADYIGNRARRHQFARSNLVEINASIIQKSIMNGLAGRDDVDFIPLVNFVYADGHCMLSVGGMIASDEDSRKLRALDRADLAFIRDSITGDPYEIYVPLLTRRERLHLDKAMPCKASWRPKEFEMKPDHVRAYKEIHPYYPAYTEALL